MTQPFRPTLYLNTQCPFCLKVRIFLIEAGLQDEVDIREFAPGSPEESATKQMLSAHLAKVTVPAAELVSGTYVADSDAIIASLAAEAGIDPATLPVLARYTDAGLGRIVALFQENAELKRKIG